MKSSIAEGNFLIPGGLNKHLEGWKVFPNPAWLEVLSRGFIGRAFPPESKPTKYMGPLRLPDYPEQCAHIETIRNDADRTVDYVRCVKNTHSGWLCAEHDHKTLGKRGIDQKDYIASRDFKAEVIEHILLTEWIAFRSMVREVVGLKSKISFELGRRMRSDPDKVLFSEPIESPARSTSYAKR